MIESTILGRLINDRDYCAKVLPHLRGDFFREEGGADVFELVRSYTTKYKVPPTQEALVIMMTESNMVESKYDACLNMLESMTFDEATDRKWLVDQTENWARNTAVEMAVMRAIGIIDAEKTGERLKGETIDKNGIPKLLQEALSISFDSGFGRNYLESAEQQWEYYSAPDQRYPFTVQTLNRITKGGTKNKTLNLIFGGINAGKSTWLIQMAADALLDGKDVAYFTMEMAEEVVQERVDVYTNDVTFDQLHSFEKSQYLTRMKQIKEKTQGRLMIKEFPTGKAHVGHFRHVLNDWKMKLGFKPFLIVIDYLTICASETLPASAKQNSNTYYTTVAEEQRALGCEFDSRVWSGCQFDRTGQTSTDVDMTNTGLAIGIQATSDFSLALMCPDEMAAENKVIAKILKSRYNNKSKVKKFLLGLDNDRQRFFDLDDDAQGVVMDKDEHDEYSGSLPMSKKEGSRVVASTAGWTFQE